MLSSLSFIKLVVYKGHSLVGSFTKIRTSSTIFRIYLVGKSIKVSLKWGVNQLSRLTNKEVTVIKVLKMGPISNTDLYPKLWTIVIFLCTNIAFEPSSPYGRTFYKKSASPLWYLTVTSWNLVYQRIILFFFSNLSTNEHKSRGSAWKSIFGSNTVENQLGTLFWA